MITEIVVTEILAGGVVVTILVGDVVVAIWVAAAVAMAVAMAAAVAMAMAVAEPKVRQWVIGGSRLPDHRRRGGRGSRNRTRNLN